MLSHGKLDLSYFFGGAENCVDLLHISVAEIAEEIICHEFWRNMFVYLQTHGAVANKDSSITFWAQPEPFRFDEKKKLKN